MDVLTIDARRLQIPASGVRAKSRAREIRIPPAQDSDFHLVYDNSSASELVTPMLMSAGSTGRREDVVLDVRPKGDPSLKAATDVQTLLEFPPFVVPVGYFAFCLALALCNLLRPMLSHAVCIALSPIPMLCILAHAVGLQPAWVGWGLLLCGWLTPSVCALWSAPYSVLYLVTLVSLAVAGCRRVVPALCLLLVAACSPLALNPQWTGLEPKLWITVEVFLSALACATAYAGGGKIIFRIKTIS